MRTLILAAALLCATPFAHATTLMPPGVVDNLTNLADQPATHTGVVFDRSTLQIVQSLLEQGGLPQDRAAAALTSISFDTYRYKEPAFYTPETFAEIVHTFHRAGWKHLVNGNQTPANEAQPHAALTDIWLHFSGADIDHVTVLIRSARDMNLIQVAGDLRPLDLLHLSGHFGIPRVDPSAVMVPAPDNR
ncbi:MAG TPA: hypothetical protein VGU46_10230 [Acidobacteriaceae bacterium]|nr:hypothetical protein [Acidobacteriaceae bacterium]